jgi:hypothetical protein
VHLMVMAGYYHADAELFLRIYVYTKGESCVWSCG